MRRQERPRELAGGQVCSECEDQGRDGQASAIRQPRGTWFTLTALSAVSCQGQRRPRKGARLAGPGLGSEQVWLLVIL